MKLYKLKLSTLRALAERLELFTAKRRAPLEPKPTAIEVATSGKELLSYIVGAYRVSIVDTGGEIVYSTAPQISNDLFKLIESKIEEVAALMKSRCRSKTYRPGRRSG